MVLARFTSADDSPATVGSLFLKLAWKVLLSKISPIFTPVLGRFTRLRIGATLLFLDAKTRSVSFPGPLGTDDA
jgi:hypothetical protein